MKKLDILPYPIYKFQAQSSIVDEVLDCVQKLEFHRNTSNNSNMEIYFNFFHEELFNFFDESIKKVKNLYFKDEIEFPIVDCWANRYGPFEKMSNHTHSNSIISGLYYANHEENFGATSFSMSDPWCTDFVADGLYSIFHIYKDNYKQIRTYSDVMPEKGSLLLFPAHINHMVKPTINKTIPRYTISFNTFPSGIISTIDTGRLYINTPSVKQKMMGKSNIKN